MKIYAHQRATVGFKATPVQLAHESTASRRREAEDAALAAARRRAGAEAAQKYLAAERRKVGLRIAAALAAAEPRKHQPLPPRPPAKVTTVPRQTPRPTPVGPDVYRRLGR